MRWSLRGIKLCEKKFGKGVFWGFKQFKDSVLNDTSEESLGQDFYMLTKNGIIEVSDDNIYISALGQHILNMMLKPEQFIILIGKECTKCIGY